MKNKADRLQDYEALKTTLSNNKHVFVTGFSKLTVAQDFELRKAVRGAGGRYKVIKNTLAAKASEGTPAAAIFEKVTGMSSIVYTDTDPVALAKALTTYAKANPALTFKAGMVEGRAIDIGAINDLANLPSREEILAKVLFLINSPAQRLVTAISGVGRNLAVVVDQAVKENKFQG